MEIAGSQFRKPITRRDTEGDIICELSFLFHFVLLLSTQKAFPTHLDSFKTLNHVDA